MSEGKQKPQEPPLQRAVSWSALYLVYLPAFVMALGAGIALPAIPTLAKSFDVGFGLASGEIGRAHV